MESLSRTSAQSAEDTPFATPAPYSTSATFHPTGTLFIKAHGIEVIHLLGPNNELEIPIIDTSGNTIFKADRPNKRSPESVLQNAYGAAVAKTSDRMSNLPLRTIIIGTENGEVEMKRKGLMTRACIFAARGWEGEWCYGRKEEGAKLNGQTLLVLEKFLPGQGEGEKVRVAQLLRDQENRMGGWKRLLLGMGAVWIWILGRRGRWGERDGNWRGWRR